MTGRKSPPIERVVFLSLLEENPSDEFLRKMRAYLELSFPHLRVKKASASTRAPNGLVVDVVTGLDGMQLSVTSVSISGNRAEPHVRIVGSGSITFHLEWRGREWVVLREEQGPIPR